MPTAQTLANAATEAPGAGVGSPRLAEPPRDRARLVLVLSALGIGLLTKLSFEPGPASGLEVGLGVGASAAFLLAIATALYILGAPASVIQATTDAPLRPARSGRVLVGGFLAGLTLMVVLGLVAGVAALEEPASTDEPTAPFQSTAASRAPLAGARAMVETGGVDRL